MSRNPRGLGARIPNIDIGKAYDSPYESVDIHCESFGRLAAFFGRNMPVHRHDRFLQLHYLASGDIRLQLEEDHYQARAPLLFLTPPTVPHAFITGPEADGHVLTLRQELACGWLEEAGPDALSAPFCVELGEVPAEWADMARRLPERLAQLQRESEAPDRARIWRGKPWPNWYWWTCCGYPACCRGRGGGRVATSGGSTIASTA
ncbi:AraC family ligand binding domain-containing protein [Chromobacterium haemolyticum]|nr:AraC family ligand binding domain-containing protein [Chromobacterium haemolyticum]